MVNQRARHALMLCSLYGCSRYHVAQMCLSSANCCAWNNIGISRVRFQISIFTNSGAMVWSTPYCRAEVGSIRNTCISNTYLKYFLYLVFGIWNTANWVFGILVFKILFVSRCIRSNTPFKILFPNTFNVLSTCYFKQPCIVDAVNFSDSHSRVAFVKGCGTNEESDWFNNFIFNFNSRNWWFFFIQCFR